MGTEQGRTRRVMDLQKSITSARRGVVPGIIARHRVRIAKGAEQRASIYMTFEPPREIQNRARSDMNSHLPGTIPFSFSFSYSYSSITYRTVAFPHDLLPHHSRSQVTEHHDRRSDTRTQKYVAALFETRRVVRESRVRPVATMSRRTKSTASC